MQTYRDRQSQIDRHRQELVSHYPQLWKEMIREWRQPGSADRVWLMYSANYLFRTAGIRWALDPLTLKNRASEAPEVDVATDMGELSFVVLTHRHADHLDLNLLKALRESAITWIVPEFMQDLVIQAGIPEEKIVLPVHLQPLHFGAIRVTPFNGNHWENDPHDPDKWRGVRAIGYFVEFSGKSWLFPGDTRTYDPGKVPAFKRVDGLFMHLWLGQSAASLPEPPQLELFCQFCVNLGAPRIIITHLHEIGRNADGYWDDGHFHKVANRLNELSPDIIVQSGVMGDSFLL
jgi:L-ascorbate metabolism protein UlaG (beta-lactamase superfamily)